MIILWVSAEEENFNPKRSQDVNRRNARVRNDWGCREGKLLVLLSLRFFFAAVVHNEAGEMGKANPSRREKANYINLA